MPMSTGMIRQLEFKEGNLVEIPWDEYIVKPHGLSIIGGQRKTVQGEPKQPKK